MNNVSIKMIVGPWTLQIRELLTWYMLLAMDVCNMLQKWKIKKKRHGNHLNHSPIK